MAARDAGAERAAKRVRMSPEKENVPAGKIKGDLGGGVAKSKSKKSKGREQAKENSKLRKEPRRGEQGQGRGVLSLSRLNVLARPKERRD